MAAPMETDKTCVICGQDCAHKPRTKDNKGRYYCRECHEQALARQRAVSEPPEHMSPLLESLAAPPVVSACPSCGRALHADAVLCTACGYSTQAGFRMAPPSAIAASVVRSAPWFLSPIYLYFKPAAFFRTFVHTHPALLALFAWIFGIAGAIDRIEGRMILAQARGNSQPFLSTWPQFWGMVIGTGAIAGMLYFAIGGWWYRVRLKWSGVSDPDITIVRRVYVLSSLVFAIPMIISKVADTALYQTPVDAAARGFDLLMCIVLIAAAWSICTSYIGVRTVFDAKGVAAAIWFLILPLSIYVFAFGVGMVVGVLSANIASAPQVQRPALYQSHLVSFSYPSNWKVDRDHPQFVADSSVIILEPTSRARFRVMIYDTEQTLDEIMSDAVDFFRADVSQPSDGPHFTSWGAFTGQGRTIIGWLEGESVTSRTFATMILPDTALEISEEFETKHSATFAPGFALIQSTLRVQSP